MASSQRTLLSEKNEILRKVFLVGSIAVVMTLPFSIWLNGVANMFLTAIWVLEGRWKAKYETLRNNKVALAFIAMYLLHVGGLIYTENIEQGLDELEKRVAFIIFPVIFSTTSLLDRKSVETIGGYFVATCFIASLICLTHGFYRYYYQGTSEYLFYHKLGTPINFTHAIYLSFYVGLAIFFALFLMENYWGKVSHMMKGASIIIVAFLISFLVFLSSKILIPTVFILLTWFLGRRYSNRINRFARGGMLIMLLVTPLLVILSIPNVRDRFEDTFVNEYDQVNPLFLDDYAGYHFTAGAIRLAIWKMSLGLLAEKDAWLFGVGTGDTQDELTRTYIRKHVYPGDRDLGTQGFLHYNAHNQFMQFFLTFGLFGLVLFVCLLLVLLEVAISRSPLLGYLLLLFLAFSLTESTLHVQKGIVAFAFFSALLSSPVLDREKINGSSNPTTER